MKDKIGIITNRLVYGFTFAFLYQFVIGIATSLLALPLTGNLQDLIVGVSQFDAQHGPWLVGWWIVSTIIITAMSLLIIRYKKYISPYKGEKDIQAPPRITAVTAIIIGAIMSFLFFLLDLFIGMIPGASSSTDILAIYQSAINGDLGPLAVSIIFSISAGFIIVGVTGKTARVKQITDDMNIFDIKRITKKSSSKSAADMVGLQPGALVHIGERKVDKSKFDIFEYGEGEYSERQSEEIDDCFGGMDKSKTYWINTVGIHDAGIVKKFGKRFDLHKLTQSDIMNTSLRPKIDIGDNHIFLILKMPHFEKDTGQLLIEQISMILGRNYVLSFQEITEDVFGNIRERIRTGDDDMWKQKSDYLTYLLVDALIDNFFTVLEQIGMRTERLEEELMTKPGPNTLQTIHILKRQMITLRKIIWPIREGISSFERTTSELVSEHTRAYLRDVYNHAIQVMDTIESLRDMVGGMLDTYLSSISNKMNEVMKTLTVIASIFIPITFIAGLYGTNFEYIPELAWEGSYFVMLGVMVAVAVMMIMWFKKKEWL